MRINTKTKLMTLVIIGLLASISANASTYKCDGTEVTRGKAIVILASNPKAECFKIDKLTLNEEKGTLNVVKTKKAEKQASAHNE